MRISGKILSQILKKVKEKVKPGIKTIELNDYAESLMKEYKVVPSFKGYREYPAVICTSVNQQIVHAIPGNTVLQPGDIISIDAGVIYKDYHSDSTITVALDPITPENKKFIRTAEKALFNAIKVATMGTHIGDISYIIQKTIESAGYSIVKEFTGHGIGKNLHEQPIIPNFGKKGKGPALQSGMTIAIEPIAAMGKPHMQILADNWTAITKDNSNAVQVEHTILITPTGPEILTL